MAMSDTQPTRVTLAVAAATDPGLEPDKQINEDAYAEKDLPVGHLLVVCDGMGGHAGGKEASEAAITAILETIEAAPGDSEPGPTLKAAISRAGKVVYDIGGPVTNKLRPGSTAVALLCHAGGTEVAHVGDSRAYLIRNSQIDPITRDHSMVQEMVDAGVLTPEEASRHPEANKITRALGMSATVDVELRSMPIAHRPGDYFLLASDGLCDLVPPRDILRVVLESENAGRLDLVCKKLIAKANDRGGHDNITVVIARVVDCPYCQEQESPKTVVDLDAPPGDILEQGFGQVPTGGIHTTVVDDVPPWSATQGGVPQSSDQSRHWANDASRRSCPGSEAKRELARRRLPWLVVGVFLIAVGLLIAFVSVLYASIASRSTSALDIDSSPADGGWSVVAAGSLDCQKLGSRSS